MSRRIDVSSYRVPGHTAISGPAKTTMNPLWHHPPRPLFPRRIRWASAATPHPRAPTPNSLAPPRPPPPASQAITRMKHRTAIRARELIHVPLVVTPCLGWAPVRDSFLSCVIDHAPRSPRHPTSTADATRPTPSHDVTATMTASPHPLTPPSRSNCSRPSLPFPRLPSHAPVSLSLDWLTRGPSPALSHQAVLATGQFRVGACGHRDELSVA